MALIKKIKPTGSKSKTSAAPKASGLNPSKAKKRSGGDGYMAMMAPKLKNIGKK